MGANKMNDLMCNELPTGSAIIGREETNTEWSVVDGMIVMKADIDELFMATEIYSLTTIAVILAHMQTIPEDHKYNLLLRDTIVVLSLVHWWNRTIVRRVIASLLESDQYSTLLTESDEREDVINGLVQEIENQTWCQYSDRGQVWHTKSMTNIFLLDESSEFVDDNNRQRVGIALRIILDEYINTFTKVEMERTGALRLSGFMIGLIGCVQQLGLTDLISSFESEICFLLDEVDKEEAGLLKWVKETEPDGYQIRKPPIKFFTDEVEKFYSLTDWNSVASHLEAGNQSVYSDSKLKSM